MPLVTIDLIKDVFSPPEAGAIAKVTEAMIAVEGESMRPVTWVRINEVEQGDWAIGGKLLRPPTCMPSPPGRRPDERRRHRERRGPRAAPFLWARRSGLRRADEAVQPRDYAARTRR